jgi:uncharacterized protein YecE (DUF72 family)
LDKFKNGDATTHSAVRSHEQIARVIVSLRGVFAQFLVQSDALHTDMVIKRVSQMPQVLVGTSGWIYKSWDKRFYPEELHEQEKLQFYSAEFGSVEINNSFYHLPSYDVFKNWSKKVPADFVFAVKASRYLTHTKKLKEPEDPWALFYEHALSLGNKMGPILFQFAPNWRVNLKRLEEFLDLLKSEAERCRFAFEFRHESWFTTELYVLLAKNNAALCIADSWRYPRVDKVTADYSYIRYHGRRETAAPDYSPAQLKAEAKKIRKMLDDGIDVYAYFNNDAECKAIKNARKLIELL